MAKIQLKREEQILRDEIDQLLQQLRKDANHSTRVRSHDQVLADLDRLGKLGHQLHEALAKRGLEPIHHKYMVKNRGVPATDPSFYSHIHPSEDLLKYIKDPASNEDPPDLTLGVEFELRVYTNRWGHDDVYTFIRTAKGWTVSASPGFSGACQKSGAPTLYEALKHDLVNYPSTLDSHLESIWDHAKAGGTHQDIQDKFNELSHWIRVCERHEPGSKNEKEIANNTSSRKSRGREGTITFLDVLGWKGIWNRDHDAIAKLEGLHKLVTHHANNSALENTKRATKHHAASLRGSDTKVLLISDTLVIATFGQPMPSLWLHGELAAQAICNSLERGIPLRGATCFGNFEMSEHENIFVGPAVDEAAEWHEQLDWIGVAQTPSAMLVSATDTSIPKHSPWIGYEKAPVKTGKFSQLTVCNWPRIWTKTHKDPAKLANILRELGPLGPSVASKIFASLEFYNSIKDKKRPT